jgi:hypothetical protein
VAKGKTGFRGVVRRPADGARSRPARAPFAPGRGRDNVPGEEAGERRMSDARNKPKPEEPSQTPLWFAIAGLSVSLSSFFMKDLMIGDVVFWGGGVFAVIALVYYFFQPKHGLPTGRR